MIEVLVGMIASGKSTYAKRRARDGVICVNDDAIVMMLHGGDYMLYDEELKPLYKSIENHILVSAVSLGLDVLIDRGVNISLGSRRRWIALAKSLDTRIEAVCFDRLPPEVHAKRRFEHDNRGRTYDDWLEVARYHSSVYVHPSIVEGFDSCHSV